MSLKDKASKVNLGDLDDDGRGAVAVGTPEAPTPSPMVRRSGVAAITQSIATHHRVQDLEAQIASYKDARMVLQIDPERIRASRWKNRDELSFRSQRYLDLKAEIEAAGGNVQPIKVRRAGHNDKGQEEFEIVYGRRRLRACLELGLLVNTIVEDMDDVRLFVEMERENRNREDLSPWEQGVMYRDALDSGLFTSQRQMAAKLGVNQALISTAVKLASLPVEVLAAFASPLDLQYRWASELADGLAKDAARVIEQAIELSKLSPRPPAKEVLRRLLLSAEGGARLTGSHQREFMAGDKVVASLTRDRKGALLLKIKGGVLQPAAEKRLTDLIEKLVAGLSST